MPKIVSAFGKRGRVTVLLLAGWAAATGTTASGDYIGYHIGNSLTWNAIIPGLPEVVKVLGGDLSIGYHIRCGSPLESIVAEPDVTCVSPALPYGNWQNALTQYDYDYIAFQTHAGLTETEIDAAIDLVTFATAGDRNARTRFFVYSAWPTRSDTQTYRETRTQPLSAVALNTDAFLAKLYSDIVLAHPMVDLGYIPVGEVLLRLDDELRESPVAGLTSAWDLYVDSVHLNALGRYVAHATVAAVLAGRPAHELTFPAHFLQGSEPEFATLVNKTIDDVISADARVKPMSVPEPTSVIAIVAAAITLYSGLRRGAITESRVP